MVEQVRSRADSVVKLGPIASCQEPLNVTTLRERMEGGKESMAIDPDKLDAFVGRAVNDLGAAVSGLLLHIGDKLGLYKTMADTGPLTSQQLADKTGTAERYIREWLANQAAGGYVSYDAASNTYSLTEEQAFCLANEESPAFLPGGFESLAACFVDEPKITAAFRSGLGVGWHEHDTRLFSGTCRFFRPSYNANLVTSWIPALDGVEATLKRGAKVADLGCGHGSSTVVMAKAFPKSKFIGFDYHGPSIQQARKAAEQAGVADRVLFETAGAKDFPGVDYDLVTFFDCLHDMGDPVGAARHVRRALRPDGTVMLVEPFAGDTLAENLNPVGRVYYGFSTVVCTPASLSQEVGLALGAQAGEQRLRKVMTDGGFTRFRRATQTPFNLVLEVRP
ncbi:SAM-dependent methyltransferase [Nitrospira sp.]|nr:SAM-dependent methyltransferase [Nitrospira sp.]